MREESKMSKPSQPEESDAEPKVCNVCHLPYTDDECPVCKAEREHALSVIQQRGRRHRQEHDEEQ
jgi:rubrerythrin